SHFWAGLFANQQAEWAHLLFTTVVLGGFGYACFRKGRRASLRIEQKLDGTWIAAPRQLGFG
ncbi:MAG: hypothetical protein ACRDQW_18960, partial [Haloechinothrix sp.]